MSSTRAKGKITWKRWEAPPERIRKRLPKSYFLLPGSRKFPYREWKGRFKGYINCNALKVAIPRAVMTHHMAAYRKALSIYRKECERGVRR